MRSRVDIWGQSNNIQGLVGVFTLTPIIVITLTPIILEAGP